MQFTHIIPQHIENAKSLLQYQGYVSHPDNPDGELITNKYSAYLKGVKEDQVLCITLFDFETYPSTAKLKKAIHNHLGEPGHHYVFGTERLINNLSGTYPTHRLEVLDRFIVNLPSLSRIPSMRILSGAELEEKKNEIRCNPIIMPKVMYSDPSILWLGAKIGDIVAYVRVDKVAGRSLIYRVVE